MRQNQKWTMQPKVFFRTFYIIPVLGVVANKESLLGIVKYWAVYITLSMLICVFFSRKSMHHKHVQYTSVQYVSTYKHHCMIIPIISYPYISQLYCWPNLHVCRYLDPPSTQQERQKCQNNGYIVVYYSVFLGSLEGLGRNIKNDSRA